MFLRYPRATTNTLQTASERTSECWTALITSRLSGKKRIALCKWATSLLSRRGDRSHGSSHGSKIRWASSFASQRGGKTTPPSLYGYTEVFSLCLSLVLLLKTKKKKNNNTEIYFLLSNATQLSKVPLGVFSYFVLFCFVFCLFICFRFCFFFQLIDSMSSSFITLQSKENSYLSTVFVF